MSSYYYNNAVDNSKFDRDSTRLEVVTTSVGFADLLDVTLDENIEQTDTFIVVTAHDDIDTQNVCRKHGAICVPTDLFQKNGRNFNKGAAINAGMNYFQYQGWRLHLDTDILLPENFKRMLFNHTHLDRTCLYGADRIDVIGKDELQQVLDGDSHQHTFLAGPKIDRKVGHRFVSQLNGYLPLGYFQLWNASCQKSYPYSLGTAAHDDTMFSALWPEGKRRLLPATFVYHICSREPVWGENWDGNRQMPKFYQ